MNTKYNDIQTLLFKLTKQVKLDLEHRFSKRGVGITIFQYYVLQVLLKGPVGLNELAASIHCKSPTLVPVIDGLEKNKLVTRAAHLTDRRKSVIYITPKGKKLILAIPFMHESDSLYKQLSKLKKAEVSAFLKTLETISLK